MRFHELVPIGLGALADGVFLKEALFLQGELESREPVKKVEREVPQILINIFVAHRFSAPKRRRVRTYASGRAEACAQERDDSVMPYMTRQTSTIGMPESARVSAHSIA